MKWFQNPRYLSSSIAQSSSSVELAVSKFSFARYLVVSAVAGFLLVALPGCSKKEEEAAATKAATTTSADTEGATSNVASAATGTGVTKFLGSSQILGLLPDSTIAFIRWDSASDAYTKFMSSPWGIEANSFTKKLEKFEQSPPSEDLRALYAAVKPLLTELQTSFSSTTGSSPFSEGVVFADLAPGAVEPKVGAYVRSNGTTVMSAEVDKFVAALKKSGFAPKDEPTPGGKGFSLNLRDAAKKLDAEMKKSADDESENPAAEAGKASPDDMPDVTIYVVANDKVLGLSTALPLAQAALTGTVKPAPAFLASPEFVQVAKGTEGTDRHLSVAYVNVKALLSNEKIQEEIAKNSPEAVGPMKEPPVSAMLWTRIMRDAPSDLVLLAINPNDKEVQPKLIGVSEFSTTEVAKILPSASILSIGLSGDVLKRAVESAAEQSPPEVKKEIDPLLATVRQVKSLSLGLKSGAAGSPFPDLVFLVQSDDADAFSTKFRELVGTKVASSGLPLMPWQKKDLEGTPLYYSSSPFGVGLFVATQGKNVLIGSSETAVRDLISSVTGRSPTLFKTLPAAVTEGSGSGLFFLNLNFTGMANLAEGVQQNFAAFTGGAAGGFDAERMEELKKLGILHLVGKMAGPNLAIEANYGITQPAS